MKFFVKCVRYAPDSNSLIEGHMNAKVRKIAVVIPKYGLVGGAEQFASELTERLAADPRYEMHVFANRWQAKSPRITFHQIPIISFPKFLTTLSFAWFARRAIKRTGMDLIHTHDRIFEADIFTMHGIPHRIWVKDIRKKTMSLYDLATDWVERSLVLNRRCKRFLAVSGLAKKKFIEAYDSATDRVEVVHPGVDVINYQKLDRPSCRKYIEQQYGIASEDVVILFVSMNFEIKGLDTIIYALASLKNKEPDARFKLMVVGKGNVKKYHKLSEDLGVGNRVIFTGVVEKSDIAKLYRAGDSYAMLSKFDTFGLAVLEAMAASLPVIVSDHVGAKDLVMHGHNGFIAEGKDNIEQVAGFIQSILNKETRDKMSRAACLTAQDHTWEATAQKIITIYDRFLESLPSQ